LKRGRTPLHWAAANGRADCIGPLVGAGAKLEATDSVSSLALVGLSLLVGVVVDVVDVVDVVVVGGGG